MVISRKLRKIDPLTANSIRKRDSATTFRSFLRRMPCGEATAPFSGNHDQSVTPYLREIDSSSTSAQQTICLCWRSWRASFLSQWIHSCQLLSRNALLLTMRYIWRLAASGSGSASGREPSRSSDWRRNHVLHAVLRRLGHRCQVGELPLSLDLQSLWHRYAHCLMPALSDPEWPLDKDAKRSMKYIMTYDMARANQRPLPRL